MDKRPPGANDAAFAAAVAAQRVGDLAAAEHQYQIVLDHHPDYFDALLNLGLLVRARGRLADAIELVERATWVRPDSAVAWNTLGNLLRESQRPTEAIDAYRRAVSVEPTHENAHFNLGELLQNTGDAVGAADCYRRVLALAPDDAGARGALGIALMEAGSNEEAAVCFQDATRMRPQDPDVHYNHGRALASLDRLDEAEQAFRRSIAIEPNHARAFNNLGLVLNRLGRIEEAQASLENAIRSQPHYALAHANLANVLHTRLQFEAAGAECRKALAIDPDCALAHANLGTILWSQGDPENAIERFQCALALEPDRVEVAGKLATVLEEINRIDEAEAIASEARARLPRDPNLNLVTAKCERRNCRFEAAIVRLEKLDCKAVGLDLSAKIEHELGLLYDCKGDYDRAFVHFETCNQLAAQTYGARRFDKQRVHDKLDAMRNFLEGSTGSVFPEPVRDTRAPIFLVGFPRSGTTLLDQILDSHPGLQTLEEKPALDAVAAEIDKLPGGYPQALSDLDGDDCERLRGTYFGVVARYLTLDDHARLVDKYPLNISQVALIRWLFPNAKLLFSLRHPFDVCLSCFMQNFRPNSAMVNFFDIEQTAAFYAKTMTLWRTTARVVPVRFHTVRYEGLVEDIESEARRIFDFLGLEWDVRVLQYADHARARGRIDTPSYHQVVQPIYDHAKYRWRHYAKQLTPVKGVLAPFIEWFGY